MISIYNHISVEIEGRKKETAIRRSIGESLGSVRKKEILKGIFNGMEGSVPGIIGGMLSVSVLSRILESYVGTLKVEFYPSVIITMVLAAISITFISYLLSIRSAGNGGIISTLKGVE